MKAAINQIYSVRVCVSVCEVWGVMCMSICVCVYVGWRGSLELFPITGICTNFCYFLFQVEP